MIAFKKPTYENQVLFVISTYSREKSWSTNPAAKRF